MFIQVIIRKRKTNGRTDGQTDGRTDDQRETIIPRHYCVAGIKNGLYTLRNNTRVYKIYKCYNFLFRFFSAHQTPSEKVYQKRVALTLSLP